jgi:hypothetical protein
LQQAAQVYFDVAGIGAQSFFRSPLAKASGSEVVEQVLAKIGNQPFESPADRSLVNANGLADLKKSLAVKKVAGEQKAVLGGKIPEGVGDGVREAGQLGRDRLRRRDGREGVNIVERSFPAGAAVVIDVTLGKGSAQPSEK